MSRSSENPWMPSPSICRMFDLLPECNYTCTTGSDMCDRERVPRAPSCGRHRAHCQGDLPAPRGDLDCDAQTSVLVEEAPAPRSDGQGLLFKRRQIPFGARPQQHINLLPCDRPRCSGSMHQKYLVPLCASCSYSLSLGWQFYIGTGTVVELNSFRLLR